MTSRDIEIAVPRYSSASHSDRIQQELTKFAEGKRRLKFRYLHRTSCHKQSLKASVTFKILLLNFESLAGENVRLLEFKTEGYDRHESIESKNKIANKLTGSAGT